MAEIAGARLDLLRKRAGLSRNELARRVGVSQPTISRLITGETKHTSALMELARALNSTPEYLTGESDDPQPKSLAEPSLEYRAAAAAHDSLAIPMLELAYGMGGTFLDGVDPGETVEHFPRAFVRMFTTAPADKLVFSHGIGDSMEPTIGDRDMLLIDRSRDTIQINDQIWVLAANGIGMVKRVRIEREGRIMLLSDNDSVPPYQAAEDELTIIGRVIAVVRRI